MTDAVTIYALAKSVIQTGGLAVTAMWGPVQGGKIANPADAIEPLFVDVTGASAVLIETATCVALAPGESLDITDQTTSVSCNAATNGHVFCGYIIQAQTQYPPSGNASFPPSGPTGLTELIPSYLYQQYNDDQDLRAFVSSYNQIAQSIIDWFNQVNLPIYTNLMVSGLLLDWVAHGLYGIKRATLSSGKNKNVGAYGTAVYGKRPSYGGLVVLGPTNVTVTTDDIFRRIITWNFYKGDGHTFNMRWLKRRVMRFLIGENGEAPNIDQTYNVSVSLGPGIVVIRLSTGTRRITGGSVYGMGRRGYGGFAYGLVTTVFTPAPSHLANESVLKEAIESGVLLLPFQYQFEVAIA